MGKTMIITAGGIKGFLAIGGILALKARDDLRKYDEFCGVSVGSILVTLLSLNLNFAELLTESLEFDFFDSLLQTFSTFNTLEWFSRRRNKGIKGIGILDPSKIQDRIEYWMMIRFHRKLSFLDLYNLTGKTLTIVVTDRSDSENPLPLYLNWKTTPSYSISKAVAESCSIPGVFELENPSRIDGVFSDPFPYTICESEGLAFILQEELKIPNDGGLIETLLHIYSATLIPIKILLREKIKNCPDHVKVIQLKRISDSVDMPIPLKMTRDEKIKMIISGFEQSIESL